MQHTLVAVFDNRSDAQNAMDELLASGFTRTDVNVSSADAGSQTDSLSGTTTDTGTEVRDEGIGASIKHFFAGLFGSDSDDHVARYSDVVSRGHHVLTLVTQSEPEVERAADIIERFGPVDLDERHDLSGSASSLDPAMLAAGASAGSGLQKSSSMSAQSGSMGSSSIGSASYGSGSLSGERGERNSFGTQDLNDPVPKGQTFQEPMGGSMRAGDSLQAGGSSDSNIGGNTLDTSTGSTLLGTSSLQGSRDASLGGTIQTGSMQRDMGEQLNEQGGSYSGSSSDSTFKRDVQRSGVRVYSRGAGDDEFRHDWNTNYSSLGGSYDDYAPAYQYGSQMRSDARYKDRQWNDVESDLRSDWDSRYGASGGSTWEKMKAAVRRGWDKITPDSDSDNAYRSHWDSNYSSLGGSYDDYAPAYSYGSQMRKDARYQNRQWDDVESDLRSDWDTRYGSSGASTWEKMKAAVRHGWDKVTR
ncbi:MAG: general stress protein [Telluria sp.]